ncbi:M48 family metallopeptidase [Halobium salinum]|uniref:M48 family metallopeptidase n=1 Tax=Halobium salinum TaxID=1364940 RepID=A0ABD5P7N1_9EURY|nr:M48 family metalloprotease [Halobium salinum]
MPRLGVRAVGVAVGAAVLAVHLLAAVLVYRLLRVVWLDRGDLVTVAALLFGFTLLSAVLGHQYGTGRLLDGLTAVELPRNAGPGVRDRFDDVAAAMGVDPPTVLVAALPVPNALAVGGGGGRRRGGSGVVVLDYRLFRLLTAAELEAVFAHELAHLRARDALVQTVAFGLTRTLTAVGFVVCLPAVLLLSGLARGSAWAGGEPGEWALTPFGRLRVWLDRTVLTLLFGLTLLVFAHSRRREYAADDRAVDAVGDPLALARALVKLDRAANPRLSPLSPLYTHAGGEREGWRRLVATHPPVEARVGRLVERAEREGVTPATTPYRIPIE